MSRPEYREIECKSALNRVKGMPFNWSLNPYRGCVHACHYCYARASHTFFGLNAGEDFSTKILVKVNLVKVLRRELARPSWAGESVAFGTVTDAYQPAEGRYRLTRGAIEALLAVRNPMSLVTKSPMVYRDRDLLGELAKVAKVRVFFTITTLDRDLWRTLEPGTAPPHQRLRVLRGLRDAGVPAGVLLAPILPGITDSAGAIDAVAAAARAAGADWFGSATLRLKPEVKDHYFGFLAQSFPALLPRYERAYPGVNAPLDYRDRLADRVERARRRHGFAEDSMRRRYSGHAPAAVAAARPAPPGQLALPWLAAEPGGSTPSRGRAAE